MMSCPSSASIDLYRESFKYFKNHNVHDKESPSCSSIHSNTGIRCNKGKKSWKKQNNNNEVNSKVGGVDVLRNDQSDQEATTTTTSITGPFEGILLRHEGDRDDQLKELVVDRRVTFDSDCKCYEMWGLRSPNLWNVKELTFPAGLIVIRNPFTVEGQRYWISRTLLDFPHHPQYITNMDNLNRLEKKKRGERVENLEDFKLDICGRDFYEKLRWVTFGYHHDWDTKIYSENMRSNFPEDLADMTRYMSQILGFQNFEAEAAIANYYHMDSTLSGHVDQSEVNQGAPLFSLSFGQSAIFLIGGKTKSERPQPVLLQSGDIAIMSGESRLSYHGVPKILPAICEPWDVTTPTHAEQNCQDSQRSIESHQSDATFKRQKLDADFNSKGLDQGESYVHNCLSFRTTVKDQLVSDKMKARSWSKFSSSYIKKSRINLNIRQVLFPGQIVLEWKQK